MSDGYAVYAIRYGRVDRTASENFLGGCGCDDPMPMDYFVWALVGEHRTVVVDTGYGSEQARRRGRTTIHPVADGLRALGLEPSRIGDVILTHLHWDHAGNLGLFENARFHVQEREMQFAVGRDMADATRSSPYAVEDLAEMVRLVHAGRVRFAGADEALFPGVSVHLVGGHTGGTQVVRVRTAHGPLLLISDAAHYYANLQRRHVFSGTHDPAELLDAYRHRFPRLIASEADIVPGHDPLVLERYAPAGPGLEGWVARLDTPGE